MILNWQSISPLTKNLDVINESTKKIGEIVKESDVEDGDTQTPTIEIVTVTHTLRDTLALMKRSKNCFKLEENKRTVFWNKNPIKTLGGNWISTISIIDEE